MMEVAVMDMTAILQALRADLDRDVQQYLAHAREKDRLKYLERTRSTDGQPGPRRASPATSVDGKSQTLALQGDIR